MKAKRSPSTAIPLGSALHELIGGLGIGDKLRQYDAVNRWEEIVGPAIARVAVAERITGGVLFVRVSASTWRNELVLRKKEIVEALNVALGEPIVRDIKFQ